MAFYGLMVGPFLTILAVWLKIARKTMAAAF